LCTLFDLSGEFSRAVRRSAATIEHLLPTTYGFILLDQFGNLQPRVDIGGSW
jgi:hypothetical protein